MQKLRDDDKQVCVIDMGGAKTVKRKQSWVRTVNITFLIVTILWLALVYWFPIHVKNKYSEPIKKSIVVSMFFDLQRNLEEQYSKLIKGIAKNINLEKPIAKAVESVKLAQKPVAEVKKAAATADAHTAKAKDATSKVSGLAGLAGKFGVNTKGVDSAIGKANEVIGQADSAIAKVDDVTDKVNKQLDKITGELQKVAQTEIDKAIDEQVKSFLDKQTGLGTTLLTNYGIKHVYPWRPSSWPVATKIYGDLEKSSLQIIQSLTGTVNQYFDYVAWGLVIAAWAVGVIIWFMVRGKVAGLTRPFIVCPRCGHTFADKRTGFALLKLLQPWKWF